jgi:hypothetical protein
MRFVTDLSKGILGAPDSSELWEEIVSQIPDTILLKDDVKILCPAIGHGTEADIIVRRMRTLGRSIEDIQSSIYLIDKYRVFTKALVRRGYKNVITADFLEWETNMKFDVIIGNPPYQSQKGTGTQPLWPLFVYKSHCLLSDHGYLAMITPNKWCGHTANVIKGNIRLYKDVFQGHLLTANIQECSKHFPNVGGYKDSFSYFVTGGKKVTHSTIKIKNLEGETNLDADAFKFMPLTKINSITSSIIKKTKTENTYQFAQVSTGFQNRNQGSIVISMAQRLHYSKLNIYYDLNFTGKVTSKSTISKLTFKNSSQEKVDAIFSSKLYKFIHNVYWNNDNFATTFYNSLPFLDPNVLWSNESIFQHFNLTQEEIDYIEANS